MPEKSLSETKSDAPWRRLLSRLESAWPSARWRNLGVVVGCSGGADSVALLKSICEIRNSRSGTTGFVIAAHYNHALRGEEANLDQSFVAELAESCGAKFVTEKPNRPPPNDEGSMRSLRRQFFVRVAQSSGARYLATAHTADDNVETMLHHLMRGTGPVGLAGIAPSTSIGPAQGAKDFVLVRPMLAMRREQIRGALLSTGQSWREDSSNRNTDYRRNWIRHKLIPLIECEYPCAVTAMNRTVDIQKEWRRLVDGIALNWLQDHLGATDPPRIVYDRDAESAIIISAMQHLWDEQDWPRREMTTEQWRRLADTIRGASPVRYSLPGNIEVVGTSDEVTLTRSSLKNR